MIVALPMREIEDTGVVALTDSFERLFRAEYSKVVAIANRVLLDPHAAEDIAQHSIRSGGMTCVRSFGI